jgi:hypothetical protein
VFAVATVLPLELEAGGTKTGKVQLAKDVTSVFAFDGTLSRCEKALLVFWTKYSHCGCSLRRRMAVQANAGASAIQAVVRKAIVCSKHKRLDADVVSPRRRQRGETFTSRRLFDASDRTDFANQMKSCRERLKETDRGRLLCDSVGVVWATRSVLLALD